MDWFQRRTATLIAFFALSLLGSPWTLAQESRKTLAQKQAEELQSQVAKASLLLDDTKASNNLAQAISDVSFALRDSPASQETLNLFQAAARHPDKSIRAAVAKAIRYSKKNLAASDINLKIEQIIILLARDKETEVVAESLAALAGSPKIDHFQHFEAHLADKSPEVLRATMEAFSKFLIMDRERKEKQKLSQEQIQVIYNAYARLIKDNNPDVRNAALEITWALPEDVAREALLVSLNSLPAGQRRSHFKSLGYLNRRNDVSQLLTAGLRSSDAENRKEALEALSSYRLNPEERPEFLALLTNTSQTVDAEEISERLQVLSWMHEGENEADPAFVRYVDLQLQNTDEDVRKWAINASQNLHESASAALVPRAIAQLGSEEDPQAIEYGIILLDNYLQTSAIDPRLNPQFRTAASDRLVELIKKHAAQNGNQNYFYVDGLNRLYPEKMVELFLHLAQQESAHAKRAAAHLIRWVSFTPEVKVAIDGLMDLKISPQPKYNKIVDEQDSQESNDDLSQPENLARVQEEVREMIGSSLEQRIRWDDREVDATAIDLTMRLLRDNKNKIARRVLDILPLLPKNPANDGVILELLFKNANAAEIEKSETSLIFLQTAAKLFPQSPGLKEEIERLEPSEPFARGLWLDALASLPNPNHRLIADVLEDPHSANEMISALSTLPPHPLYREAILKALAKLKANPDPDQDWKRQNLGKIYLKQGYNEEDLKQYLSPNELASAMNSIQIERQKERWNSPSHPQTGLPLNKREVTQKKYFVEDLEYLSGLACNDQQAATAIIQQYLESKPGGFILDPTEGSIESDALTVRRFLYRCAAAVKDPSLVRLLTRFMPFTLDNRTVHLLRNTAEDMAEIYPDYYTTREQIHARPSLKELQETKDFLAQLKANKAPEEHIQKFELIITLLNKMLDPEEMRRENMRLIAEISQIAPELSGQADALDSAVDARGTLSAVANLASSLAKIPSKDSVILDKRNRILNGLFDRSFAAGAQIAQKIQEASPNQRVAMIYENLGDMVKEIEEEGFLTKKDSENFQLLIERANKQDSQYLRDLLSDILDAGRHEIALKFSKVQSLAALYSPQAEKFSEDLVRSSLLLHLGSIRDLLDTDKTYIPYHMASACGKVRVVAPGEEVQQLMADTILVFKKGARVPDDLSAFAGLLTEDQIGVLSHGVMRSKNRKSPCLYKDGVCNDDFVAGYNGKAVRLTVGQEGHQFEILSDDEYARESAARKPASRPVFKPVVETSVTSVVDLSDESVLNDKKYLHAVGAKAYNYGQLARLLGPEVVRPAAAVPFHYYTQFLKDSGVQAKIDTFLADPRRKTDQAWSTGQLEHIRELITSQTTTIDSTVLDEMMTSLQSKFGDKIKGKKKRVKFRSSTNIEDLDWFNGAGLYDSKGADLKDRKSVEKAIREVWASVWNDRAYLEREYFNIDHSTVAMGMLVNESYSDEAVNGVALTSAEGDSSRRIISAQHGEESVVSPRPGVRSELLEIRRNPAGKVISTVKERSNQEGGDTVLTEGDKEQLETYLAKAHQYFAKYYGKDPKTFTLDVEFKVEADKKGNRRVMFKQARPLNQD